MSGLSRFSRIVSVTLVVALAWLPVLPAFAMALKAGDAHAAHAAQGVHGDHRQDHSAPKQAPCTQHDACNGQCCAFCAQCLGAVTLIPLEPPHSRPVQTAILTALHPLRLIGSPDRPPRSLSL